MTTSTPTGSDAATSAHRAAQGTTRGGRRQNLHCDNDKYGGPEAQTLVEETTVHDDFSYVWDQDEFDPIHDRMMCYIHFEKPSGKRMKKAFAHDWRLWTIIELREALAEAGFAATEVYWEGVEEESGDGDGDFVLEESAENTESWITCVVGVKE